MWSVSWFQWFKCKTILEVLTGEWTPKVTLTVNGVLAGSAGKGQDTESRAGLGESVWLGAEGWSVCWGTGSQGWLGAEGDALLTPQASKHAL